MVADKPVYPFMVQKSTISGNIEIDVFVPTFFCLQDYALQQIIKEQWFTSIEGDVDGKFGCMVINELQQDGDIILSGAFLSMCPGVFIDARVTTIRTSEVALFRNVDDKSIKIGQLMKSDKRLETESLITHIGTLAKNYLVSSR
jgi:hypothetical protein